VDEIRNKYIPHIVTIVNGMSGEEIKCCICGSRDVLALIEGKYYCYRCGSKVIRKKLYEQFIRMKQEGLVPKDIEIKPE